jgi:hypothetical protein
MSKPKKVIAGSMGFDEFEEVLMRGKTAETAVDLALSLWLFKAKNPFDDVPTEVVFLEGVFTEISKGEIHFPLEDYMRERERKHERTGV